MKSLLNLALFGVLGWSLLGQANAQVNYNQISFNTQVSQEVANDEIRATLNKTAQANDAKTLSDNLNQTINQALAIAKKYPEVKVSTGNQSTYPRYNKNGTITGFTGLATLKIYSQNFAKTSELMAELESIMTVNHLEFGVSDQTKQTIEKELLHKVTKRFQEEAQAVSRSFGAKNYKIVNVALDNAGYHTQSVSLYKAYGSSMAMADVAKPEFEGGNSQLTYRASGTIELIQ